jgi:hypothetical protein
VRVDQARDENVVRKLYHLIAGELPGGFGSGKDLLDAAVAYRNGMAPEDRARRLDRYDPAGAEE